jgi:hypothetical protein
MQFYPKNSDQLDGAKLNDVGNKLAAYLQKKFSNHDIIIDRDKDFEDKLSAIGFIVPLDSLSQWVMSDLIGGKTETVDDKPLDNDASSEESN